MKAPLSTLPLLSALLILFAGCGNKQGSGAANDPFRMLTSDSSKAWQQTGMKTDGAAADFAPGGIVYRADSSFLQNVDMNQGTSLAKVGRFRMRKEGDSLKLIHMFSDDTMFYDTLELSVLSLSDTSLVVLQPASHDDPATYEHRYRYLPVADVPEE